MLEILTNSLMIATYQRPWDKPTPRRNDEAEMRNRSRSYWLPLLHRGA